MADMNKTYIVRTLFCGCIERRWLFGRDTIQHCTTHALTPPEEVREYSKKWPVLPHTKVRRAA